MSFPRRRIQQQEQLKTEATKLIKYFLASLTIPEKDLWVNLSPYEKDRIVPESFGQTEMGRDLLAQDYMLKQITASLIYPEDEIGKKFWKRVYEEAQKKYGTTQVPVNTFNKVWIVPEKAIVYENAKAGTAYVVESKLKVMLEQDYLALSHSERSEESKGVIPAQAGIQNKNDINTIGSQIVREIVIPELTKEINEGKNFAQLRQVYQSLILATWYKKKIKDSILSQVYTDKNKVAGVNIDDPQEKQRIYEQYVETFKKGVYNYIKEEVDPVSQEVVPRKYFSGGVQFKVSMDILERASPALIKDLGELTNGVYKMEVNVDPLEAGQYTQESHKAYEEAIGLAQGGIAFNNPVVTEDRIKVYTSSELQGSHAGRKGVAYVRNKAEGEHELVELRGWMYVAQKLNIASQEDIEKGLLGQKLREWANDGSKPQAELIERQKKLMIISQRLHLEGLRKELEVWLKEKNEDKINETRDKMQSAERISIPQLQEPISNFDITIASSAETQDHAQLSLFTEGQVRKIDAAYEQYKNREMQFFMQHSKTEDLNHVIKDFSKKSTPADTMYQVVAEDAEIIKALQSPLINEFKFEMGVFRIRGTKNWIFIKGTEGTPWGEGISNRYRTGFPYDIFDVLIHNHFDDGLFPVPSASDLMVDLQRQLRKTKLYIRGRDGLTLYDAHRLTETEFNFLDDVEPLDYFPGLERNIKKKAEAELGRIVKNAEAVDGSLREFYLAVWGSFLRAKKMSIDHLPWQNVSFPAVSSLRLSQQAQSDNPEDRLSALHNLFFLIKSNPSLAEMLYAFKNDLDERIQIEALNWFEHDVEKVNLQKAIEEFQESQFPIVQALAVAIAQEGFITLLESEKFKQSLPLDSIDDLERYRLERLFTFMNSPSSLIIAATRISADLAGKVKEPLLNIFLERFEKEGARLGTGSKQHVFKLAADVFRQRWGLGGAQSAVTSSAQQNEPVPFTSYEMSMPFASLRAQTLFIKDVTRFIFSEVKKVIDDNNLDSRSDLDPDYFYSVEWRTLRLAVICMIENLMQHEYSNIEKKLYMRVYLSNEPYKGIRIEFWGPGKVKLPKALTSKNWFTYIDPPWPLNDEESAPKEARSQMTTGIGFGVQNMFQSLQDVEGRWVLPSSQHILVGWRESNDANTIQPKGHITALHIPMTDMVSGKSKGKIKSKKERDAVMRDQAMKAGVQPAVTLSAQQILNKRMLKFYTPEQMDNIFELIRKQFRAYSGVDHIIKVGSDEYIFENTWGKSLYRLGPLIFVPLMGKEGKFEEITPALVNSYEQKLGQLYPKYYSNIIFIDPESAVMNVPVNDHVAALISVMLSNSKSIEGATVIDVGAGSGILSLVALAMGAKRVFLIENDVEEVQQARVLLKAHGYTRGVDFDILQESVYDQEKIKEYLRKQKIKQEKLVGLVNIGPWDHYGNANENAVELLADFGRVDTIINGGYLDREDVEKHRVRLGVNQQSLERMGYAVEKIRFPAQKHDSFRVALLMAKKTTMSSSVVDKKGGIDLTPANMNLQTRNAGEEIKFNIDTAMLQQLQNALGFVPVIINIQPMTNLREFLGVAS